jgi:FkbM family methyltransferase
MSGAAAKPIREFWFQLLGFVIRHLSGKGLERLPFVRNIYRFLTRHLIGEDIISVNVHGQKMYVNAASGFTLLSTGTYESERFMTILFTKLVTDGMIAVDVGAYVGYYTLLAARAVGNKGKIFCFEPEPSNYALLLKNIEENNCNNVVPVQKAVTNTTGTIKLFIAKDPSGHSVVSGNPNQLAIMVNSTTLDDFFVGREYPIHVIKIDVEGAEMRVLQGMRNIIAKNRELNIFTEFSPEALKVAGCLPKEYFKGIANYGFDIYWINEQKQSLEPAKVSRIMKSCQSTGYVNLLCHRGQRGLL